MPASGRTPALIEEHGCGRRYRMAENVPDAFPFADAAETGRLFYAQAVRFDGLVQLLIQKGVITEQELDASIRKSAHTMVIALPV